MAVGFEAPAAEEIERAARLNDVSKLGLPEAMVTRGAALTDAEITVMRKHVTLGAQMIAQSRDVSFAVARDVALHHHERWDGGGYPHGLAGAAIPEAARITAITEVFDVLTHGRSYRAALSPRNALVEIQRVSGMQFEPRLVDAFVPMMQRLIEKYGAGGRLDEYLAEAGHESAFLQAKDSMKELFSVM